MRLAFVNVLVNEFRLPLMRDLASLEDLDITVYHSRTSNFRFWEREEAEFPLRLLPGFDLFINDAHRLVKLHVNPSLANKLVQGRYDAYIVFTWSQPSSLIAQMVSKITGKPVLLWDDTFRTAVPPTLMPIVRRLITSYSGYLVGSTRCADYYCSYGIDPAKVFLFPNVVDNTRFALTLSSAERSETRKALGLPVDQKIVLYCGQLVQSKGLLDLLAAWKRLSERGQATNAHLLLVGKGALERELTAYLHEHNLTHSVTLAGYVQYDELPKWFAVADLFVLLSYYDPFGLVINEAMCARLPVIATETVGAVGDLVKDGVTGIVVPPNQVEPVVDALAFLLHDDPHRQRMAKQAWEVIQSWDSLMAIKGLRTAMASVCEQNSTSLARLQGQ